MDNSMILIWCYYLVSKLLLNGTWFNNRSWSLVSLADQYDTGQEYVYLKIGAIINKYNFDDKKLRF